MSNPDQYFAGPDGGKTLVVTGVKTTYKTNDDITNGAFDYFEAEVPPESGPPIHIHHNSDESLRVISGEFIFQIEGKDFIAEPGAFIFVPKGIPHSYKNIGTEVGTLAGTFTPGGTYAFYDELVKVPEDDIEKIMEVTKRHGHEVVGPPIGVDPASAPTTGY